MQFSLMQWIQPFLLGRVLPLCREYDNHIIPTGDRVILYVYDNIFLKLLLINLVKI